jgi:hypothetical protein
MPKLQADKKASPVSPWFIIPFSICAICEPRNDFSQTERGGTFLLGFGVFQHGRTRGEGVFRFFGFVQDQKEPVCLSGQAIYSTYQ